jgi:hypothetical protein
MENERDAHRGAAMPNRIRRTNVQVRRLSPVEAEIWISADLDRVTPSTALGGKMAGPRCPEVSTLEVAYPLQPFSPSEAQAANRLAVRVLIPEPNLWTEAMPFVYEGAVELWQDGECCDRAPVSVAFKGPAPVKP